MLLFRVSCGHVCPGFRANFKFLGVTDFNQLRSFCPTSWATSFQFGPLLHGSVPTHVFLFLQAAEALSFSIRNNMMLILHLDRIWNAARGTPLSMGPREFLDWGSWGGKIQPIFGWHCSVGWGPRLKKQSEPSTSIHLPRLPPCGGCLGFLPPCLTAMTV